jgi:hypothetical protein
MAQERTARAARHAEEERRRAQQADADASSRNDFT